MIPLKIRLKGFMCYHVERTISFRSSTLWALCGENGSGKSALFDAMVYALYGENRMDKSQEAYYLIHHHADGLEVEFDFAVGENEYRVRRTLQKKARGYRPSFQAFHLSGPDMPSSPRCGPQPIAGTERKTGLEEWVEQTIGLNKQAFTFAVLLQQERVMLSLRLRPQHVTNC